jgi:hypothetical protein
LQPGSSRKLGRCSGARGQFGKTKERSVDDKPPVLLSSAHLAGLLGWTTQRALRWMKRHGIALKDGSRYVTTRTALREAFPEVYTDIVDSIEGNAG